MSQITEMTVEEKKRIEALDKEIESLQDKVFKAKSEYDALVEQLLELVEQRYPERKEEHLKETLYNAYRKSDWSLEEVLSFLDGTFEDRFGF